MIALAEGCADGSLGERSAFNAYSWAAVASAIFPNKEYDRALNLRNQLGATLTAKERLDASIVGLKWLMETFPDRYHPILTKQSSATENQSTIGKSPPSD
jgi:hypothetical protein